MSDDPYLPKRLPPEAEVRSDQDDDSADLGRPGCLTANGVTVIFLMLTVLFLGFFALLMVNPYVPINPFPPRTPLPVIVIASPDPNQPTVTRTPTKLPDTPALITAQPSASPTASMTPTATETQVVVTLPPTSTRTPQPSPTTTLVGANGAAAAVEGALTPPPPGNPAEYTRSPYPFTVYGDAVAYMENPNPSGCRWASVAGSVTNLQGEPLAGLAINIRGEGLDEVVYSGDPNALTYGTGGFEVYLNGAPLRAQYMVQILSAVGAPLSEEITVTTSALCDENVAIVNFVQNHDY